MKSNKDKKSKGFTLIELLVVISIIGLLSSLLLANLSNARMKANDIKKIQDMRSLGKAIELYYIDHGFYPVPTVNSSPACSCVSSDDPPSWNAFGTLMSSYISRLPVVPPGAFNGYPYTIYFKFFATGKIQITGDGGVTHNTTNGYYIWMILQDYGNPYSAKDNGFHSSLYEVYGGDWNLGL